VIEGKTFSEDEEFDRDRYFGKKAFAHSVVRPNAGTIDFSGFRPLLTNLVAVMTAHKASIASAP
jgi:hypothetical protein